MEFTWSMGGASKRCFDPTHGHDLGGGRYQGLAMHRFCERLGQLRLKHPEIVYVDENGPEYLMDELDGTLSHHNITPDKIPLRQAVYHDYWLSTGRSLSPRELASDIFDISMASLFTCGQQLGRIEISNTDLTTPVVSRKIAYLGALINAKYRARKWLNYGQMLRPPTLEEFPDIPAQFLGEEAGDAGSPMSLSSVFASCWRAADGSVALVLTNASDQKADGSVIVPLERYFPGVGSVVIRELGNDASSRVQAIKEKTRLRCALAPYGTSVQIFTNPN